MKAVQATRQKKILKDKKVEVYESSLPVISPLREDEVELEIMPWLVPACSPAVPSWSAGASEADLKILSELNIAGLIPGEANTRYDIGAIKWPFARNAVTLWKFEAKGDSDSYSVYEASKDLMVKCGDADDSKGRYHAMLISLRGQLETEVWMWKISKGGSNYFRVLVLISGLP